MELPMKWLIPLALACVLLAGVATFLLTRESDQEKVRKNLLQIQLKGDTHDTYGSR
jgi:hypothetical protein